MSPAPQAGQLEDRLVAVFQRVFGLESVTEAMSINTIPEWDSLAHVGLVLALEAEFQVSITPAQAIEMVSVRAIRDILTELGVR